MIFFKVNCILRLTNISSEWDKEFGGSGNRQGTLFHEVFVYESVIGRVRDVNDIKYCLP